MFSTNTYEFVADEMSLQFMTSQRVKQKRFGALTQSASNLTHYCMKIFQSAAEFVKVVPRGIRISKSPI